MPYNPQWALTAFFQNLCDPIQATIERLQEIKRENNLEISDPVQYTLINDLIKNMQQSISICEHLIDDTTTKDFLDKDLEDDDDDNDDDLSDDDHDEAFDRMTLKAELMGDDLNENIPQEEDDDDD